MFGVRIRTLPSVNENIRWWWWWYLQKKPLLPKQQNFARGFGAESKKKCRWHWGGASARAILCVLADVGCASQKLFSGNPPKLLVNLFQSLTWWNGTWSESLQAVTWWETLLNHDFLIIPQNSIFWKGRTFLKGPYFFWNTGLTYFWMPFRF